MSISSTESIKPQGIIIDIANKAIQITWADGHVSIYDFTYLRRACPCAECFVSKPDDSPNSVRNAVGDLKAVSDVRSVGGYALQFFWADGHAYGIYDFESLRKLCPCEEHKKPNVPNLPK